MFVILAGFRGNGKRRLAEELTRLKGWYWYDTRGKVVIDAKFVYQKASEKFPILSKMYDTVVFTHPCLEKSAREFLIAEAGKHFTPVVFVWIDVAEDAVKGLLQKSADKLRVPVGRLESYRAKQIAKFQAFDTSPITFVHHGSIAESVQRLALCISEEVGH